MAESWVVKCQHCSKKLKVPLKYRGQRIKCPKCQRSFRLPNTTEDVAAAKTSGEPPTDRNAVFTRRLRELIRSVAESDPKIAGIYTSPDVPAKKEHTARQCCDVPASETIHGLLDLTILGSSKNVIVFAETGLYFKDSVKNANAPDGRLAYADFAGRQFTPSLMGMAGIGNGESLTITGASFKPAALIELLRAIRQLYCLVQLGSHSTLPPEPCFAHAQRTKKMPKRFAIWQVRDIEWPRQCIGCFDGIPQTTLPFGMRFGSPAKPEKSSAQAAAGYVGMGIGNLAGGLVGGFIGQAVGESMFGSATIDEDDGIVSYDIPICKKCLTEARGENALNLAGPIVGGETVTKKIDLPFMEREIVDNILVISLKNATYASNFLVLNKDCVFDAFESCAADRKLRQRCLAPERPHIGTIGREHRDVIGLVEAVLNAYRPVFGLMVGGDISEKKERNVRKGCSIPDSTRILAFNDCTVLGSAKKAIVFTEREVFFPNSHESKKSELACIEYTALPDCSLRLSDDKLLEVRKNEAIDLNLSSVDHLYFVDLLHMLRQAMVESGR